MSTTDSISTVLILGATSGIGQEFARYFHSQGKTVLAAGRRLERLSALQIELPGLITLPFDLSNITTLDASLTEILTTHPLIDAVLVLAGKQEISSFVDSSSSSLESITAEITLNLTMPILVARTMIPHLIALKRPTTFLTTTSGLAFIPIPLWPVYNSTKAGLHIFNVSLRAQLAGTNVKVVELAPPYVDTELDRDIRDAVILASGGPEKAHPPMPLKEYMDVTIAQFEAEGGVEKEVATGFSALGVEAWRGAVGPIMSQFGIEG